MGSSEAAIADGCRGRGQDSGDAAARERSGDAGGGAADEDAPSKPLSVRNMRAEVLALEKRVRAAHSQVDALWQRRHVLGAHAEAAQIAVEQCMALLRLGSLLHERRRREGQEQEQGQQQREEQEQQEQGHHEAADSQPQRPERAAAASQQWCAHVAQMEAQLRADLGLAQPAPAGPAPDPSKTADSGPSLLGWSPERAAQWFGGPGVDLSTDGLRRAIRRFVHKAGPLYFKSVPGSGSPDAARATRELAAERERLMAYSAVLVVSGHGHAASEVIVTPLDGEPATPPPAGRAGGDGGGGGADGGGGNGNGGGGSNTSGGDRPGSAGSGARAGQRDAEWMVWVVSRVGLDEEQEELLFAALQSLEQRTAPGLAHSSQLMGECERHQGDTALLQEVVARASAGLFAYQIMVCVFMLSVYATILRPDQLAILFLSAWPWCPSLSGLRQALLLLREQRQAQPRGARRGAAKGAAARAAAAEGRA